MRLALLLVVTAALPALARVPSRLNHGLGGRLAGAGLHSSASKREPKGLEDLSWWPEDRSHSSINRAFVRGKTERKQAPRPATTRTPPVDMVAASDESCLMGLSLATCLGGLANWVSDSWGGDEEMGDKHVVYANGEPSATIV